MKLFLATITGLLVFTAHAQIQSFLAPSGLSEICEYAESVEGLKIDKDDTEKLQELCEIDFYFPNRSGEEVGVCPKLNSTNPGTNIYTLKNTSKEEAERNLCLDQKLLAKYKQSISCSYFPGIISYYLASKIFKTVKVPESVYRTMDPQEHKKITKQAIANSSGLINQLWKQFDEWENRSERSRKVKRLFTEDGQQLAGALSVNPKGESKYYEIMGYNNSFGKKCGYDERPKCFMDNSKSGFKILSSSRDINQQNYDSDFQNGSQLVQKLKDVTSMLVMDYIFAQRDRFGNQHYYEYYLYQNKKGNYNKVKASKYKIDEANKLIIKLKNNKATEYLKVSKVKVLLMKDNDCSVVKGNIVKDFNMLPEVQHLDYELYQQIHAFNSFISSTEGRNYFKKNAKLTDDDLYGITKRSEEVKNLFVSKCLEGNLKFDLKFSHYFGEENYSSGKYACHP